MAAARYNLLVEQGTDFRFDITVREKDTQLPVNFTGATVRGQIRQTVESDPQAADFVIDYVDRANGQIALTLTDAVTSALVFEKGVYDVEVVWSTGSVDRLLNGNAIISKEVTR